MTVFSYFDASPNLPDQGQLIRLWHDSWKRHGWTPRLLHPRNAQRHPWWEKALARLNGEPSPDVARWFALDQVEKHSALLVDYSVVNFGMIPRKVCGPMSLYGTGAVGSSRPGRRLFMRAMLSGEKFPNTVRRDDWSIPYQSVGWYDSPLVNFTSYPVGNLIYRKVLDCGRKLF